MKTRSKWIVCAPVMEELTPYLPPGQEVKVLEFALHIYPKKLNATLQEEIDLAEQEGFDEVVLGYGMCSQGTIGLRSKSCQLVVPRVDDCIGLFLSSEGYKEQLYKEAGTFFLTKGWIECDEALFNGENRLFKKYDARTREMMVRTMLRNYTRLALIDMGHYPLDGYRDYVKRQAERYDLRYEELPGTNRLLRNLAEGHWDDEFVSVSPGQEIAFEMFIR